MPDLNNRNTHFQSRQILDTVCVNIKRYRPRQCQCSTWIITEEREATFHNLSNFRGHKFYGESSILRVWWQGKVGWAGAPPQGDSCALRKQSQSILGVQSIKEIPAMGRESEVYCRCKGTHTYVLSLGRWMYKTMVAWYPTVNSQHTIHKLELF